MTLRIGPDGGDGSQQSPTFQLQTPFARQKELVQTRFDRTRNSARRLAARAKRRRK